MSELRICQVTRICLCVECAHKDAHEFMDVCGDVQPCGRFKGPEPRKGTKICFPHDPMREADELLNKREV